MEIERTGADTKTAEKPVTPPRKTLNAIMIAVEKFVQAGLEVKDSIHHQDPRILSLQNHRG